jgi:multiple sugar transport system substrate-binding protein
MNGLPRWKATLAAIAAGTLALSACGGGSGFDEGTNADKAAKRGTGSISVLIGSSGDAETNAVKSAAAAWAKDTGNKATVSVASDLAQQLSQGFTSGKPADVFYLGNDTLPAYAANGSLAPFASELSNVDDFYDTIKTSFTFDGDLYAAPKDFSTLALIINEAAWADAGLTDADIPTTWDQLATVAKKLTTGKQVGLSFGPEFARIGVFMAQAGGWLVSDDGKVIADSPENAEALTFVKQMLNDGSLKFPSAVDAGWGGEAFGKQAAAMTIEGNWIVGALTTDFPDVKYRVAELPEGPAGKGTMQFNGGWGIAADSKNQETAQDFVEYMTQTEQQLGFAKAFGVMPSVSSAAEQWKTEFPAQAGFLAGADYSKSIPNIVGIADVVADFNSQIEGLKSADPEQILKTVQQNLEAIASS